MHMPNGGQQPDAFVHLEADGVSLLLDLTRGQLPAVLHWGASLGSLSLEDATAVWLADIAPLSANVVDRPIRLSLVPESWTGWMGEPGLAGSRDGADWSPKFTTQSLKFEEVEVQGRFAEYGAGELIVLAVDDEAELTLEIRVALLPGGLVRARAAIRNDAADRFDVDSLVLVFPVPPRGREVLDFAGRWGKERMPQRTLLQVGRHERENRRGRTGLDAATVLSLGEPGFGFQSGQVWGVHVGFSGNHRHYAERLPHGVNVIGGGELLFPGEVLLETGEQYETPWVYAAWADGLDAQAHRFHTWLRSRPNHPTSTRPVTLNVWEAVEMDHELDRLLELADRAAEIGVERYVLDDGWMLGRRTDTTGLGDWIVDPQVWPQGLHPLVNHVRALGMEFGLWFEPEMISISSEAARAHPEWILQTGGRIPVAARFQQVIDLTNPDAFEHVYRQVAAIVDEYALTYIKWDHNRDLVDAGGGLRRTPAVHEQTLAVYRLMAGLKAQFLGLEIESCSSGGGRVDLGILEHTERVWGSDCIDPLERQQINRWTMQLIPPEMLGTHVGANPNHSTDRVHRMSFRAGTALFGHFGIEKDLTRISEGERSDLREWVDLYKQLRAVMHTGSVLRLEPTDTELQVYGAVAADRSEAVVFLGYLGRSTISPRGRITIPGLDPDRHYRVRPILPGTPSRGLYPPVWFGIHPSVRPELFKDDVDQSYLHYIPRGTDAPGVVMSGRALAVAGVQAPASMPDDVVVLHVSAIDSPA